MDFEFEMVINAEISKVFAFHADPDNLSLLNRNRRSFRMIRNDGHVKPGASTCISERFLLFSIPMTFEHVSYEPLRSFSERLVKGIFSRFEHVHEFETRGEKTLLRDRLSICLPWYLGGELATKYFLAPLINKRFAERHNELDHLTREGIFESIK